MTGECLAHRRHYSDQGGILTSTPMGFGTIERFEAEENQ
jgi:hypothetical protein